VNEDGVLYVHWINVKEMDEEATNKEIVSKFEVFLKRIVE
jgi:multisubunit Na+/H+ antiporter MnhE subunit